MKIIEKIMRDFMSSIENRRVLEVACGDASFSIEACAYAKDVISTDIESFRIDRIPVENIPQNIEFKIMDASNLEFDNGEFDTAVCYNALSHLGELAYSTTEEMLRVVNENGKAIFIGTWKMENPRLDNLKQWIKDTNKYQVEEKYKSNTYRALIVSKL